MLRAGFARVDITPSPECGLLGYEFRQSDLPPGSAAVHDPLRASVLVLDDGCGKPAVLVSLDLCILLNPLARALRQDLAAKIHTDWQRVIIACSHTHSGPFPQQAGSGEKDDDSLSTFRAADGRNADQAYAQLLRQRLLEAVSSAAALTLPVEVTAQETLLGMGYNRRVPTAQGLKHCWNPQEQSDLTPGAMTDPTCTLVMLRQQGGPRSYALWSVGVHGTVLGRTSRVVSADWAGRAVALIEQYLPDSRSMFFHGASGNTHPWIATQERPENIEPVARAAAGMVALLAQATRGQGQELRVTARTVTIGPCELDLSVWRLGCAYVVAAPVELFGELAMDLRRRLGGPLLLCTTANGWTCYWPHAAAYAEGGYEVDGAKAHGHQAGDGEKLIDELVRLAGELA